MTLLIGLLCFTLFIIVVIQIGKISEVAGQLRGERDVQLETNQRQSRLGMIFVIAFIAITAISAWCYKNYMLGYGPHISASEHGNSLDQLFNITTIIVGIVFVITQILLFWYAFKFRGRPGHKADHVSHDNTLEIIWTAIPAVTMAVLVAFGLNAWSQVMADVEPGEDYMEVEVSGQQFAWTLRYPGPDGKLGGRYYKNISGINPLGQLWEEDKANLDDFMPGELVFPVGKKVRVKITALDVLHSFDLPHFRVKMDAVPGMPTYFVFTPSRTTEDYRQGLREYAEYQVPSDPSDPDGPQLWETFEYELACAELCGNGHFSMKKIVKVVSQEEYDKWLTEQSSYYMGNIRNTKYDPYIGELLAIDIENRNLEFNTELDAAIASEDVADDVMVLKHLFYETGSSKLDAKSQYELENVTEALKKYPNLKIEFAGHTDNTGNEDSNMTLSDNRAKAVLSYVTDKGISGSRMSAKGYGQNEPIGDNGTDEGRQLNRRTEMRILSK